MNNLLAKRLGISCSIMDNVASGEALEDELVKALLIAEEIEPPALIDGKVTYVLSK